MSVKSTNLESRPSSVIPREIQDFVPNNPDVSSLDRVHSVFNQGVEVSLFEPSFLGMPNEIQRLFLSSLPFLDLVHLLTVSRTCQNLFLEEFGKRMGFIIDSKSKDTVATQVRNHIKTYQKTCRDLFCREFGKTFECEVDPYSSEDAETQVKNHIKALRHIALGFLNLPKDIHSLVSQPNLTFEGSCKLYQWLGTRSLFAPDRRELMIKTAHCEMYRGFNRYPEVPGIEGEIQALPSKFSWE